MSMQFDKFLNKHSINPEHILYIVRKDGKTVIHLNDGRMVQTFSPLKSLVEKLTELSLLSVNKGVVLNEREIVSVEKGVYTMTDGATFPGRIRTPGAHNRNARLLNHQLPSPIHIPKNLFERFSVLDKMEIPFCVVEIVFDQSHHGVDFIFRYCNRAMAEYMGQPLDALLNRSSFELFPDGDKKWAITYAEVALNGVSRDVVAYHAVHDTYVRVHCFQPKEGYCACIYTGNIEKDVSI